MGRLTKPVWGALVPPPSGVKPWAPSSLHSYWKSASLLSVTHRSEESIKATSLFRGPEVADSSSGRDLQEYLEAAGRLINWVEGGALRLHTPTFSTMFVTR
ncbi:hypothetical protein ATANTOWER_020215 [Ataeniobius toweri]|uniref:Uncharacterized protein n=1 Tax=Ataeniobius toweri TaxID=208326 RepID=A0ABU7C8K2_9TELE|nr:hypothetical protein [Ataeniobius toweri]